MVLNSTKLPWMRDDRVILSLTIGVHSGDDIIEAWTQKTWSRRHVKRCRISSQAPDHKFSESKWEVFMGFENIYNLKVRTATNYTPAPEEKRNSVILPNLSTLDLLDTPGTKHDFVQGSISDSLYKIHTVDRNAFNIQRSKNLIRQILDFLGFSCFRYRYNYSSNKIAESCELAQYVDTSIIGDEVNAHNARLNHRFFIIDAVSAHTTTEEMKARIAGKALITAMFKYMAGVSRTSEIEVFIMVGRGTRVRLYRIVFEPEYLGDISKGLEPETPAVLWEDGSGEQELMRLDDRVELVRKIEHVRKAMHVRI
ncbi:protein of unknown function [Taphrina deformans PYCC 5710]|uniref:Uncharacterized protein n=1 Tax=Taphrina deformans (strain PYCC 5710 / ATCC 11124 / CBS 356.35 / IMI 108563 / JCM 9778 / NBRC 8474) TaxID=1097556 RepID=R4X9V8_TAPDE|nr:protein of unknown function [Taphrina deformans PYCC 5710]|eukprot:CCG82525.1 protein of unknown function [Taphrina deformans PYCC 5710]